MGQKRGIRVTSFTMPMSSMTKITRGMPLTSTAVLTFFWVSVYVLGMKELLESLGDYGKYGGWILLGIANVMFFCYDFSMGSFPALYRRYLKPRISPGAHRES